MAQHRHAARRRLYDVLERETLSDPASRNVHAVLVGLVLLNVAVVVLESVPSLAAAYGPVFIAIELATVAVFTVEYGLRLWCAPEHAPWRERRPAAARMRFVLQPQSIIDLVAILPFYLGLFGAGGLEAFLLLRLFRFFKLARYSPGLASLVDAIHSERRALLACGVILLGTVLLAASAMHFAEKAAQPEKFGSIPDAMYWAVITLTTVGFGDVVPVTTLGKVVAGLTAVAGLVMLALPVGIIASAFAREIHRHDFVVTWGMVARVPLFADMAAAEIGAIMRYLRSQSCEAGEIIARKGEDAHAMYIIASGQVEICLKEPVVLGTGDFFGEIAALKRMRRTVTVRALTACKLLVLEADDLHHVMDQNPAMARQIETVAETRLRASRVTQHADLLDEELHRKRAGGNG